MSLWKLQIIAFCIFILHSIPTFLGLGLYNRVSCILFNIWTRRRISIKSVYFLLQKEKKNQWSVNDFHPPWLYYRSFSIQLLNRFTSKMPDDAFKWINHACIAQWNISSWGKSPKHFLFRPLGHYRAYAKDNMTL